MLVADSSERVARLRAALADGSARPVSELARLARVPTAGVRAWLRAQTAAGSVRALREGAHTYYAWAGRGDRQRQALVSACPPGSTPQLRLARSCYRHLAGGFGVALYSVLRERAWLVDGLRGWRLTPAGVAALAEQGLPVASRLVGRDCRDWTLRQPHLGGALGVAITAAMLDAGWFRRAEHGRTLVPCAAGDAAFARWGVDLAALRAATVTAPVPGAACG